MAASRCSRPDPIKLLPILDGLPPEIFPNTLGQGLPRASRNALRQVLEHFFYPSSLDQSIASVDKNNQIEFLTMLVRDMRKHTVRVRCICCHCHYPVMSASVCIHRGFGYLLMLITTLQPEQKSLSP